MHVAVDELHHLTRIESVVFSQVDEQTAIASLRRTLLALSAVAALSAFLAVACGRRLHNLRRVGVVLQELAELQRNYLLQDILLVEVLEVAVDVLHERSNLFVVHIHLLYLVDGLEKLLRANLLRRRQRAVNELLAYHALHFAHTSALLGVDDRDRGALLARTTRTTRAVSITLGVARHTIVDDVREVVHVQTARSHVCSHEQLRDVLAELLHSDVALLLREVAVQRFGVVSVAYEFVSYLLRLSLGAAEHDAVDARIEVDDALQREVLVLRVHHIVDMVDILSALVARTHHNLLVVVQIVERNLLNFLAHRSREEQRVAVCRHIVEYLVDAVGEAHVEHLVSLVEHNVLHGVELGCSAVHKVDKTTRCSHDNLRAVLQRAHLVDDRRTAVYCYNVDSFNIL